MKTVIGSVPYLNEKPLTRWFNQTPEGMSCNISVVYAPPSQLAIMLKSGDISAALVSSFEHLKSPSYSVIPGVSISGHGEILSVRAFGRLPWKQTESVALDTSSLTSSALLKILLDDIYDSHPDYINHAPDLQQMLTKADAALLIGDMGMLADDTGLRTIDLGEGWRKLTNLPFTYAVWLSADPSLNEELASVLTIAKEWGKTQVAAIAKEESERLQCPESLCLRYLTEIMDYDLDEQHMEALSLFRAKSKALGLLSDVAS